MSSSGSYCGWLGRVLSIVCPKTLARGLSMYILIGMNLPHRPSATQNDFLGPKTTRSGTVQISNLAVFDLHSMSIIRSGTGRPPLLQTQLHKITTRETIYKHIRKFPVKIHRARGQDFPICVSCRYLVKLGQGKLGLPVADPSSRPTSTLSRTSDQAVVSSWSTRAVSASRHNRFCSAVAAGLSPEGKKARSSVLLLKELIFREQKISIFVVLTFACTAPTSSLTCLSCGDVFQSLHALTALPCYILVSPFPLQAFTDGQHHGQHQSNM